MSATETEQTSDVDLESPVACEFWGCDNTATWRGKNRCPSPHPWLLQCDTCKRETDAELAIARRVMCSAHACDVPLPPIEWRPL